MHDVLQYSLRNIAGNGSVEMAKGKEKKYTMQEMADILKVNKTTVYRYLKKKKIIPATVESNTNYYTATVLQQLKKHFSADTTTNTGSKSANDKLIEVLQQQVHRLQDELQNEKFRSDKALDAKDRQIDELNARLRESHQLQLGLQKKLKMLPELKETTVVTDNAVSEEDSSEDAESSPKQDSKEGFWHRFFGKKNT